MTSARRPSIAPAGIMLAAVRTALAATSVLAVAIGSMTVPTAAAAGPRTWYVSCHGNDSASGRSTSAAWRTLAKASEATLHAGDRLRLERGCSFTGPLRTGTDRAPWIGTAKAPINIDAYGTGELPTVRNAPADNFAVTGRYLIFSHLATSSDPTSRDPDSRCLGSPRGRTYGWRLHPGSDHVTIKHSKASDLQFGVWIEAGSHHDRVIDNDFRDVNVMDPDPASDSGAVAVAIHGDDNEVAWNHIEGSDACSLLYGRDGAAVDIYGGQRNTIHHNIAVDNNAFLEIGRNQKTGSLGRDTTIAYNEVRSSLDIANFLIVRGAQDKYGPTPGTDVRHNSVYLSGAHSYAVQCMRGCTAQILVFRDNIVWAQDRVGALQGTWSEARNIWFNPGTSLRYVAISSSSRFTNPRFVDAPHGDLRLQSSSPAVDRGGTPPTLPGGPRDLAKVAVPRGRAPDIGAWERP